MLERYRSDLFADGNLRLELLEKLTGEAVAEGLLVPTLTAGELPAQRECPPGLPPGKKKPSLPGGDSRGGDPPSQRNSTLWRKKWRTATIMPRVPIIALLLTNNRSKVATALLSTVLRSR